MYSSWIFQTVRLGSKQTVLHWEISAYVKYIWTFNPRISRTAYFDPWIYKERYDTIWKSILSHRFNFQATHIANKSCFIVECCISLLCFCPSTIQYVHRSNIVQHKCTTDWKVVLVKLQHLFPIDHTISIWKYFIPVRK